jgi:hypothetical protein
MTQKIGGKGFLMMTRAVVSGLFTATLAALPATTQSLNGA